MLGLASGEDFLTLKGVVEAILAQVNPGAALRVEVFNDRLVVPGRAARLFVGDHWIGVLGEVSPWGLKQFELRTPATIAEMKLAELFALAVPVRLHRPQSPFPSVVRDLNIVLDEPVRWSQIEEIVRAAAGELLEDLQIVENAPVSGNAELQGRYIFRDSQKIGVNKKSLVFRMTLRSASETLTHEAVDAVSGRIVERIATDLHGALRT